MYDLASYYAEGRHGLPQDLVKAFELYQRAAKLGCADAYYNIGFAYVNGVGVERDEKKARYYYELAAIGGAVTARYNLGILEKKSGNIDRALKHFMIAVEFGCGKSWVHIKRFFMNGHATEDDYDKALRAYRDYVGEIKSAQRDAAALDENDRYY